MYILKLFPIRKKQKKKERQKKRDRKTVTLKISSKNCIKIKQQIFTVFVYCCSGKIFQQLFSSIFLPLYHLLALPIFHSIIFTILPVNLKPGKSSTLPLPPHPLCANMLPGVTSGCR
jgi:hypothetical protein